MQAQAAQQSVSAEKPETGVIDISDIGLKWTTTSEKVGRGNFCAIFLKPSVTCGTLTEVRRYGREEV